MEYKISTDKKFLITFILIEDAEEIAAVPIYQNDFYYDFSDEFITLK